MHHLKAVKQVMWYLLRVQDTCSHIEDLISWRSIGEQNERATCWGLGVVMVVVVGDSKSPNIREAAQSVWDLPFAFEDVIFVER